MSQALAALDGAPAPPALARDLEALLALPLAVRRDLGRLLDVVLPEPVPDSADATLTRLAEELALERAQLAPPLRALRFLVRSAASKDLPAEQLAADVRALLPERGVEVEALVLEVYEPARSRVQAELAARAVASHGKVLTDVAWRLELVTASSEARGLKLPVVTVTLRFEEDGRRESVTFHAVPTVLRKLKAALDALLA